MAIKVKVDFRDTVKALNVLEKKQVPFATAKALTRLAQLAQTAVKKNLPKRFDLRRKSFITSRIKIISAKKKDVNTLKAFSAVKTHDQISFMVAHEKGKTRRKQGGSFSVPSRITKSEGYRKKTGGRKKTKLPSHLLKDYPASQRGKRGSRAQTKGRKPFILDDGGKAFIVRRLTTKKNSPLKLIYTFAKKIRIKPTWGFEKTVNGVVKANAKRIFEKELSNALATAR